MEQKLRDLRDLEDRVRTEEKERTHLSISMNRGAPLSARGIDPHNETTVTHKDHRDNRDHNEYAPTSGRRRQHTRERQPPPFATDEDMPVAGVSSASLSWRREAMTNVDAMSHNQRGARVS